MKKLSLYITLALAGLFMGACSDDYTDWTSPQSNAQEDAITFPDFKATAVKAFDLNNPGAQVKTFALNEAALPEGYKLANARIELTADGVANAKTTTVSTTLAGLADSATIQKVVSEAFGLRPIPRTLNAHVFVNAIKNGQAAYIDAGTVKVVATPKAPKIDTEYYLTGNINDWKNDNVSYPVKNSGADVYTDPVFSITLTEAQVAALDKVEFKLTPKSKIGTGDWSECIAAAKEEGKVSANNAGGNLSFDVVPGAKVYKLTFNLLDQTWSCTPLSFDDYLYMAGNANGWKHIDYLYGKEHDGKYTGFMYLDQQGFKFCTQPSWSGDNYGAGLSTAGGNITISEPEGYYKVDVDLANATMHLTPITRIGVIGDATVGGWGSDQAMTYNKTDRAWEINNIVLSNGSIKFRANNGWDINWGGTVNKLTTDNGANIAVTAGTYNIKFYAWADGKGKCEITPVAPAKRRK